MSKIDKGIVKQTVKGKYGLIDKGINGRTGRHKWKNRLTEALLDKQTEELMDRQTEKWKNGLTENWL